MELVHSLEDARRTVSAPRLALIDLKKARLAAELAHRCNNDVVYRESNQSQSLAPARHTGTAARDHQTGTGTSQKRKYIKERFKSNDEAIEHDTLRTLYSIKLANYSDRKTYYIATINTLCH